MEGFIYCTCVGGVGSEGIAYRRIMVAGRQRQVTPAMSPLIYMMPQDDKGLVIWHVQADWQYWRTVW